MFISWTSAVPNTRQIFDTSDLSVKDYLRIQEEFYQFNIHLYHFISILALSPFSPLHFWLFISLNSVSFFGWNPQTRWYNIWRSLSVSHSFCLIFKIKTISKWRQPKKQDGFKNTVEALAKQRIWYLSSHLDCLRTCHFFHWLPQQVWLEFVLELELNCSPTGWNFFMNHSIDNNLDIWEDLICAPP